MRKYTILTGPEYEKHVNINGADIIVHRIKATEDLELVLDKKKSICIKKDTLGGWVEGYHNLNPLSDTNCWIHDNAIVCQNARVKNYAQVTDNAIICGNAVIDDDSSVKDSAFIGGNCELFDFSCVSGNAKLSGDSVLLASATVSDNAIIIGTKETNRKGISKQLLLKGSVYIYGNAEITGASFLNGDIQVFGNSKLEKCYLEGRIDIWDSSLIRESLNGRYLIANDKKICYFEKTRIPRKFLIKNGSINKEENTDGNTK